MGLCEDFGLGLWDEDGFGFGFGLCETGALLGLCVADGFLLGAAVTVAVTVFVLVTVAPVPVQTAGFAEVANPDDAPPGPPDAADVEPLTGRIWVTRERGGARTGRADERTPATDETSVLTAGRIVMPPGRIVDASSPSGFTTGSRSDGESRPSVGSGRGSAGSCLASTPSWRRARLCECAEAPVRASEAANACKTMALKSIVVGGWGGEEKECGGAADWATTGLMREKERNLKRAHQVVVPRTLSIPAGDAEECPTDGSVSNAWAEQN